MGTPDDGQIPSRTSKRIAVYWIARNGRHQDCGDDAAARAQSVRPGLRNRTSAAQTEDGHDRALRTRGDSAGARAARPSTGSPNFLQLRVRGGDGVTRCLAVTSATGALVSSAA